MSRDINVDISPVLSSPRGILSEFNSESVTVKRIPPVYSNPSKAGYFRPWRFTQAERSGTSKIFYAKTTKFRVILDVAQFSPNLTINVNGRFIEIEGTHNMIKDKLGRISRWMKRRYKVPPDVKLDTLTTTLRTKGSLVLNAERDLEDSLGKNFSKDFSQQAEKKSTTPKSVESNSA